MACGCKKNRAAVDRYKVKLPGGLTVTKNSKAEADTFSAKHPGSTVVKA